MGPPLSKEKVNALGRRLASSTPPLEEDLALLEEFRARYDEPLQSAARRIRGLGMTPSVRRKTTNTIVEKLRREKTRLSTMQDIGGLRVVVDMTLSAQDALKTRVLAEFPSNKVVDRRAKPRFGYRAIHVVLTVDGLPLELQIRTLLQDRWAQMFEKLSDLYGRELRYGAGSDDPLIADFLAIAQGESEMTGSIERNAQDLEDLDLHNPAVHEIAEGITALMKRQIERLAELERLMEDSRKQR